MIRLTKGRYTVCDITAQAEMAAVLALRGVCFGAAGGTTDRFDATATQMIVWDTESGTVVASFRMSVYKGAQITGSYAGASYDLSKLSAFDGPMLELGRFCIHPDHTDPDILRIAWAMLTAFVDEAGVSLLFGCSSFAGTEPATYADAFALLKARHLGSEQWTPTPNAPEIYPFKACLTRKPDMKRANVEMPALLRTYLMMGGWVSDHAVIDREMGTLHVFTGLEIGTIPASRKKLLRALV